VVYETEGGSNMAESYDVAVKVISQKGTCEHGHKVGDEWVIKDTTPQGICLGAFNVIYPDAWVLKFGGSFPWASEPDVTTVACPDPENPVVFELRRLPK
jgi:uncharacterized repeat protein (TIGR04076 family)